MPAAADASPRYAPDTVIVKPGSARGVRALSADPAVRAMLPELERSVAAGELTPTVAAERILAAFGGPLHQE